MDPFPLCRCDLAAVLTLPDFARPALKWSGFALYAAALLMLATGVVVAVLYGAEVILDALFPALGLAIAGTALIGLSSLLSEIAHLREDIAAMGRREVADGHDEPLPAE
ncbi:hypothetical protein [Rubricoccus marinus]|uniref:Uncharacterized protein n=1 Tax=Rubricoccus marinus TaxID=716817 RepID=A0A259TZR5_9BACT|nr:hypothetical protein [Rubricoccus marinus]OZC03054.1 hypothetical protein BSZ36_08775 [Rubricoccus marinus]